MRKTGLVLGATLTLACAYAYASGRSPAIVDEGQLGRTHVLASGVEITPPEYPAAYAENRDDVCVAISYTVGADGNTGDFHLINAWSNNQKQAQLQDAYFKPFADAAAQAVSGWRFAPKDAGNQSRSVRTVATLAFKGQDAVAGLADRCRVQDLAAYYEGYNRHQMRERRREDGKHYRVLEAEASAEQWAKNDARESTRKQLQARAQASGGG